MRFFHTVRYLRPQQVMGQVSNRVRALCENPHRHFLGAAPGYPGCRWSPVGPFLPPTDRTMPASDVAVGRLSFLNDSQNVGWPPRWNCSDLPKLWQYNLHYFDWLWALDYEDARSAVLDWMASHPLQKHQVGWEPYPTSLRLMNWAALFWGRFAPRTEGDPVLLNQLWRSIFLQAEWLCRHLEYHLLANHLLENAAALTLVGTCLGGPDAERWRRAGLDLLTREIPEQVLADGMHFERSPMYHLRVTYLLAALLNTGDREIGELVRRPLRRSLNALAHLCHMDGQLALLNDSATGVYLSPKELTTYARGLGEEIPDQPATGPFALPDAGYFGSRCGDACVVCDAGQIGPDYQPGHAHGDIFSFELSYRGRRLVVDSGVHDYDRGSMRQYCRSTRAHNTVEIAGQDQCEFWAAFRVARRGRPHDVRWEPDGEGFRLRGWHDGYRRLRGRPIHSRQFLWRNNGVLAVRDRVTATREVSAVSRLHLAPDCRLGPAERGRVRISHHGTTLGVWFAGNVRLDVEESFYCPEFGKTIPNQALRFTARGASPVFAYCIAPDAANVQLDCERGVTSDGRFWPW
jgi:uncharacterized heparinase superfamily protein